MSNTSQHRQGLDQGMDIVLLYPSAKIGEDIANKE